VKIIDRLLVACGTSGGGVVNKAGSTPLHEAVANNQLNITRLLVQRGRLTIDARNKQGETPLDIGTMRRAGTIFD
jgi:ankyrin repeat protein